MKREPRARRASAALVVAAALLAPGLPAGAEVAKPQDCIERLNAALLDAMRRADELGFEGRREALTPTLTECFDLAYMAEKAAGRHWKALGEADRTRMVDAFTRMTLATYASRFDEYAGQKFEILDEEPSAYATVLVRTRIVRSNGETVELTYRLRSTPSGWRIIDVFLKGTVSELAMRRSEYSSVITRDGFDTLIDGLHQKVRTLEGGSQG